MWETIIIICLIPAIVHVTYIALLVPLVIVATCAIHCYDGIKKIASLL